MTNLNTNEIESTSTNTNVKVEVKGSDGGLEVRGAGGNDGVLQLNCSTQSHGVKLKSPANSAGQNYTMILPDNQIEAGKYLKVKSVTGTGADAVGQLEYATVAAADLSNLDASNITSGTLSSDRFTLPASSGAGLKFIQKQTVSSNNTITQIDFTSLDSNSMYKIVGKRVKASASTVLHMQWLDNTSNPYYGSFLKNTTFQNQRPNNYYSPYAHYMNSTSATNINMAAHSYSTHTHHGFIADLHTGRGSGYGARAGKPWLISIGMYPGAQHNGNVVNASFDNGQGEVRILHGIRFVFNSSYTSSGAGSGTYFQAGTEISLFKYIES